MNDKILEPKQESFLIRKLKNAVPGFSVGTYKAAVVIYIIYASVLALFRIFVIENSVEFPGFTSENLGYRLQTNFYTSLFFVLYSVGVIFAFGVGLLSHRVSFSPTKRSNPSVFVSSLAGFCMVGCAGFFVCRSALSDNMPTKLGLWVVVLMLFTGVYFAMDSIGFIGEKTRPFFSFGTIAFCITRLIYEFLECHDKQSFSSNEYHMVSLVLILCFFCCSSRLCVYKKVGFWYKSFGLLATLTLLIYTIPEIYLFLFEPYSAESTFVFCIIDTSLAFYVAAKLLSAQKTKEGATDE